MSDSTTPRRRQRLGGLLPGLVTTGIVALACNFVLEASRLVGVEGYPWRFKTPTYALMFLLGALVLWLVVGVVHAVVGRTWATVAVCGVATTLVAVADLEKIRIRREPLLPSDTEFLGDLGFVGDMVGPRLVVVAVLVAVAFTVAAFVGARALGRRFPRRDGPVDVRLRVGGRVLTCVLCLACLAYLGGFNRPGNLAREVYDGLGASWRPWSQERNYLGNGFVGGFLYNLDVPLPPPPPGYGQEAMAEITARYARVAARINRHRAPDRLHGVNVVMVLSESFSDPRALAGVNLDSDPIPFTRHLMASTTAGPMLAEGVGGGTANMEFEALTGMSMSDLPRRIRTPYQMLVPEYSSFPSAVRFLEETGHRTVAIHPFSTEMYRRREVYRAFGFDQFVHDTTMHDRTRSGHDGYISDAAAFDEVRRQLASEDQPLFVNLVTMQNHMPYGGRYDEPVPVTGPDGAPMPDIGQYTRGLTYTDRALHDFVDELSRSDEPTVLGFYGDHLPGSYPGSVFDANPPATMHQTPFFVWSNVGGRDAPQPVTSPIHLMDLALQQADAAVTPYYALLQSLRRRIPAMDSGMMFDARGRRVRAADLGPRDARLLHDYRLVEYDLSSGERYALAGMFGTADADRGSLTAWTHARSTSLSSGSDRAVSR